MLDKKRIEILQKQNAKLKEQLERANAEIARYKKLEEAMQNAKAGYEAVLVGTKTVLDEYRDNVSRLQELLLGINEDINTVYRG